MSTDSSTVVTVFVLAAAAAGLYLWLKPTSSAITIVSPPTQQQEFRQAFKDLDKIPISLYDPNNTPRPGQPGWELNYNRS